MGNKQNCSNPNKKMNALVVKHFRGLIASHYI